MARTLLALLGCLFSLTALAVDLERKVDFNIPAQTLSEATVRAHLRANPTPLNEWLAAKGRTWSPGPPCETMTPNGCFANSYLSLGPQNGLVYAEGYALKGNDPSRPTTLYHHAWCVDAEGIVHDHTWADGTFYFGVLIAREWAQQCIYRHYDPRTDAYDVGSIINEMAGGTPLVLKNEEWAGALPPGATRRVLRARRSWRR